MECDVPQEGSSQGCVLLKTAVEAASSEGSFFQTENQGVFANVDIAEGHRFGPFEETLDTENLTQSNCSVEEEHENEAENSKSECSWMKLVKHASKDNLANLDVLLTGGQVYFVACQPIKAGEELLLCDDTVEDEGAEDKLTDKSCKDATIVLEETVVLPCSVCQLTFDSKSSLREHKKSHKSREHQCEECQKGFPSRRSLAKHQVVHKTYSCDECPKVFKYYKALAKHRKEHKVKIVEKTVFPCDKCGKVFKREAVLLTHTKREHETEYPCLVCHKVFSKKRALRQHVKMHEDVPKLPCPQCEKSFSNIYYLRRHQKMHSDQKPFTCEFCQKAFREHSDCVKHKRIHTNERRYKCKQCGKAFNASSGLKAHSYIHQINDPENPTPFKCDLCDKSFKSPLHRNAHQRRHIKTYKRKKAEYSGPEFDCELCQQTFRRCCQFTRHKAIHSGQKADKCEYCEKSFAPPEKPYHCEQCGKSFMHSTGLSTHALSHTSELNFQCDVCEKKYASLTNLRSHQRQHVGEAAKKFKCKFCGKAFFRQAALTMHTFKHTGERPHKCPQCGKAFFQRISLDKHLRIHNGVKPYKCDECGKCFTQKSTLVSHIRVHTGQKPYQCTVCSKAFRQSGALGIHMRSHADKQKSNKDETALSTDQPSTTDQDTDALNSAVVNRPVVEETLHPDQDQFTLSKEAVPASACSVVENVDAPAASLDYSVPDYVILTPCVDGVSPLFPADTSAGKHLNLIEEVSHLIEVQTTHHGLATL